MIGSITEIDDALADINDAVILQDQSIHTLTSTVGDNCAIFDSLGSFASTFDTNVKPRLAQLQQLTADAVASLQSHINDIKQGMIPVNEFYDKIKNSLPSLPQGDVERVVAFFNNVVNEFNRVDAKIVEFIESITSAISDAISTYVSQLKQFARSKCSVVKSALPESATIDDIGKSLSLSVDQTITAVHDAIPDMLPFTVTIPARLIE